MCKEPKQSNCQNNQNPPNNQEYWEKRDQQQNSGKTSAEIAAELWDSWVGNPDDHEITRNVNKDNINP